MRRWLAYGFLAVSFATAVLLKGGVYARQWEWSALGVCVAGLLGLADRRSTGPGRRHGGKLRRDWISWSLGALAVWMVVPLVPLPPSWVHFIELPRWDAAQAARVATGESPGRWLPLSLAAAATFERLLDVLPAMAAFLLAREMGTWWPSRPWIAVAPVVLVAVLESLLGMLQFSSARATLTTRATPLLPSGTYVNHNHFAGLLEIALPLAAMWTISSWRRLLHRRVQTTALTPLAVALAAATLCLFTGILISLSRMGLLSTLAACSLMGMLLCRTEHFRLRARWQWALGGVVALAVVLLAPAELVGRFGSLAGEKSSIDDDRIQIWADTGKLIADSPWTGTGLGAYEHGLYRFRTSLPGNTVDFAHNDYLQILAELGIPGAILVSALAMLILNSALKAVRKRGDPHVEFSPDWGFSLGLLGGMIALGLHGFTDFNLYIPANALALAWVAGLACRPTPTAG